MGAQRSPLSMAPRLQRSALSALLSGVPQGSASCSSSTAAAGLVVAARASTVQKQQRRRLHQRAQLPYSVEKGIEGFLSPQALKTIAVDWQEGLLHRLNERVRGTKYESLSAAQTVIQTASDPLEILTFNLASEALNTAFFLSTLSTNAARTPVPSPDSDLYREVQASPLGSFPALVSHMSAHVAGLHPSSAAYVWLVADANAKLGVVTTHAGGTLLANSRRQSDDGLIVPLGEDPATAAGTAAASEDASASEKSGNGEDSYERNILGRTQRWLQQGSSSEGATNALQPLLCVCAHPHTYMTDYGVWGREEYVQRWWTRVDWDKVEEAYKLVKDTHTRSVSGRYY